MSNRMNPMLVGKLCAVLLGVALIVVGITPAAGAHGDDHDHTHDHDHEHSLDDADAHGDGDAVHESHVEIESGRAVFTEGHIDLNVLLRDGVGLGLFAHDATVDPPVWSDIDEIVIAVSDDALQSLPEDPAYNFVGADAGSPVHVLDLVGQPGLPWLGWSAEDAETLAALTHDISVELMSTTGPGLVSMFIPTGVSGDPQIIWRSDVSTPQTLTIAANSHGHGTWVFSKPGVYTLEVFITATLASGELSSRTQFLRFAVGSDVDPMDAFAVSSTEPSGLAQDRVTESNETSIIPVEDEQSSLVSLRWVAIGAVLLGLAVGAVVYRDRRTYNMALERDES